MAKKDKVVKEVVEEEVKEVKVDDWKHGDIVPEGYRALFTADGYIFEKL